jgi:hypothetical protein
LLTLLISILNSFAFQVLTNWIEALAASLWIAFTSDIGRRYFGLRHGVESRHDILEQREYDNTLLQWIHDPKEIGPSIVLPSQRVRGYNLSLWVFWTKSIRLLYFPLLPSF